MINVRRKIGFHLFFKQGLWMIFLLGFFVFFIRWTKGAGYVDFYSLLMKPILPGTTQREWIQEGDKIEKKIRLNLLEKDNIRLRKALSLQAFSPDQRMAAAVISRSTKNNAKLVINDS